MKKAALILVAVATLQLTHAQVLPLDVDTNTMTVTDTQGNSHPIDSEFGAFFVGFALMVGFCVTGMALRMTARIPSGHRPSSD